MKHFITVFVLMWFIPSLAYAENQEKGITIKAEKISLREGFEMIRAQSNYHFLYNSNLIDDGIVISVNIVDETIENVLQKILPSNSIKYRIIDNQIVLYPHNPENNDMVQENNAPDEGGGSSIGNVSPILPRGIQQDNRRVITGTITEEDTGEPISGVAIMISGVTGRGSISDENGHYSIEIQGDAKSLEYQFMGYETVTMNIGQRSIINVAMKFESVALNEVVVSAGYVNEKKKNISGSVVNVSGKELEMAHVNTLQRALEGKAAGVQIVSANGLPGASINVNIRGKGTISASTQPLFIIDGVQVSTGDYTSIVQTSNALSSLNPDDIESIDILKDAATASIYGAQAANGIVVIKTKRGSYGKPRISFTSKIGFDMVSNTIDLTNSEQYIDLTLMGMYNRYGVESSSFINAFNAYKERGWIASDANSYPNISFNTPAIPNDDWYGSIYRLGVTQEYQLSLSAGTEHVKSYVSASYNNSQASTIYNYFNRFTIRANIDIKATNWLDVSNTTVFGSNQQRQPVSGGVIAAPTRGVLNMIPYNRIYNEDGSLNVSNLEGAQNTNPIQASELNVYNLKANKLNHNTELIFHILKGLDFRVSGALDYNTYEEHQFLDPETPQGVGYQGYVASARREVFNITTSETLNYVNTFNDGKHRINALLGFEFKEFSNTGMSVSATDVPSSYFKLLSQTGSINSYGETYTGYRQIGLFARVGYTLKDKYIVNAIVRRDGSSRFGDNNRWGIFPAIAIAWRIGDESFIKNNLLWINDLKIKASYGLTGNSSIGNFVAQPQFSGGGRYLGMPGISPSVPGNKELSWETKYSFNAGFEWSMFKDRIYIGFDYFDELTADLLYDRPVPRNTGYSTIPINAGSVRNNGVEISLSVTPIKRSNFTWEISSNFTYVNNRIVSLADGVDQIGTDLVVGQPVETYFTYPFAGINPADGRPMWYDSNGYIVYKTNAKDRVYLNGPLPPYYGGIINNFTIGRLDISFLLQWQKGATRYNADKVQLSRVGNTQDRNQRVEMYTDYWRTPGQITDVAQPMYNNQYLGPGGNTTSYSARSSQHNDSTDFLKLKNVSIGYRFPTTVAKKLGLSGLSISCLAYNLWTATPYTGYDPEFTGSDSGTYPQSRTVTFSLKLDF